MGQSLWALGMGIPWVVIHSFLRSGTNGRIFERPWSIEDAMVYLDE